MAVILDENKALLVTWTTYGSWLPGDDRGFVSNRVTRVGTYERKRNALGELPYAGDERTRAIAQGQQKWTTTFLTPENAWCVAQSLCELANKRGWLIPRASIMRQHVHVVVIQCPDDGPAVRRVLKGVTQSDLCKHEGKQRRWWTHRGSNRYVKGAEAIEAAIKYVAEQEYKLAEVVAGKPYRCRKKRIIRKR